MDAKLPIGLRNAVFRMRNLRKSCGIQMICDNDGKTGEMLLSMRRIRWYTRAGSLANNCRCCPLGPSQRCLRRCRPWHRRAVTSPRGTRLHCPAPPLAMTTNMQPLCHLNCAYICDMLQSGYYCCRLMPSSCIRSSTLKTRWVGVGALWRRGRHSACTLLQFKCACFIFSRVVTAENGATCAGAHPVSAQITGFRLQMRGGGGFHGWNSVCRS